MPDPTDDPLRPRYHLTCDNWLNDPIPFYDPVGDLYHVFYQHNPGAAVWGDMHWGHAVSRDLLRWEHKPIALAPTPGGPDRDGVWTGCIERRPSDGRYVALYTAIPALGPKLTQVQAYALSDDLETWEKPADGNPFLAEKPAGYGDCWRDPQVFRAPDNTAYMVIGGEKTGVRGGAAFLYRAADETLTRWEYVHPLFEGGPGETGHDFECPDFFQFGPAGEWLLLTSRNKTWWHAGRLTPDLRFERTAFGACDEGPWYAAKSTPSRHGYRYLFGWIRETRPEAEQVAAEWSGVISLPRRVKRGPDGRPFFLPGVALRDAASARPWREAGRVVGTPEGGALTESFSPSCEIAAEFLVGRRGKERGLILTWGDAPPIRLTAPPGRGSRLHVFCDRSVVEAFTSDGTCTTYRLYPTNPDAPLRIAFFSAGGDATAHVSVMEYVEPVAT